MPKSPIEKRNLKFFSPVSREERETGNSFPQFREEKEKSKRIFTIFERRKRNGFSILKLQEEKEKVKTISPFSRREREILNAVPQFWEEKEKSRVHNFREEKEKFPQTSCFQRRDLDFDIWNGPFLTSNMLPKRHYIAVCHHTSDPDECIFLSKIWSISHRKRKRNCEQNLINRE